jgi:hypothetical protein
MFEYFVVWLCIFQTYKLYQICHSCATIKNFILKIYMLVGYTIDYVWIYFYIFLNIQI